MRCFDSMNFYKTVCIWKKTKKTNLVIQMISDVTYHDSTWRIMIHHDSTLDEFAMKCQAGLGNMKTHSVTEEYHLHCTHQSGQFDHGNWRHSGDDSGFVGGFKLRFRSLDVAYRWYTISRMSRWFLGFDAALPCWIPPKPQETRSHVGPRFPCYIMGCHTGSVRHHNPWCPKDGRVPKKWTHDASGAEISWLLPSIGGWCTGLTDRQGHWMPKRSRKRWRSFMVLSGLVSGSLVSIMQRCYNMCDVLDII